MLNQIKNLGFDDAAFIQADQLNLMPEVRKMCEDNRCGAYGKKWSCPPYCGTLDECNLKVAQFEKGIVMTTITKLEDSFDFEGMEQANKVHDKLFLDAINLLRAQHKTILPLGAGGCRICEDCSCPDKPCRFPEKMVVPMEAYGLLVCDVCEKCGVNYYNGEATVTYISCILY